MSNLLTEIAGLHQPSLESVADVLSEALPRNFVSSSVKVVDCPDLTQSPYSLAGEGLCGNTGIIDVGGPPYLVPLAQTGKPQYNFKYLFDSVGIHEKGLLIGAGAGPHQNIGTNCELIANVAIEDGMINNQSYVCKTEENGHKMQKLNFDSFALLGNFFYCEGKPGKVLEISATSRSGPENFVSCIRKCLAEVFADEPVGLGGVFVIEKGLALIHIMPKFSEEPLNSDEDVNKWLKFFEMPAPLVCVGELISHDPGLDLRVEHFHCFSNHGDGGHYHYDVTPEEVVYKAYFNIAQKVCRIDRPLQSHNIGRD